MINKEKWIEEVFDSMKNSQRAQPSSDLFSKIEAQIKVPEVKTIHLQNWKKYCAAACFLLLINASAIICYKNNLTVSNDDFAVVEYNTESLISSYQIYD